MIKKIICSFLSVVFFFILFTTPIFSQETPPSLISSPQLLGQNHSYSVTFRGNGEAIISLKVIFSNLNGEQPINEVSLRVPKTNPEDIFAYQVVREPRCIRYQTTNTDGQEIYKYPSSGAKIAPCLEYENESDYYYYSYGNNKYQKAKTEYRGDTIIVSLPQPIKVGGTGSYILYYRALGYAKKDIFGAYDYTFETLKVEDKIDQLQVGINTDSDQYLRDAKGKVEYRFADQGLSMKSASANTAFSNNQFDSYYQQIGMGQINKSASNLQPLESYSVKGSFADSKLKLYAKNIITGLVIGLIVLFFLVLLIKLLVKKIGQKEESNHNHYSFTPLIVSLGVSFINSFAIVGFTILVFIIGGYIASSISYEFTTLLMIILIIISIGVYSVLVFLPALFVGLKKGVNWGIATFVLTIFWLIFYAVIIFMVVFITSGSGRYPDRPVLMKSDVIPQSTQVQKAAE